VEIVDFSDGSTLMEAFASGQLDIAFLGLPHRHLEKQGSAAQGGGRGQWRRTRAYDTPGHRHQRCPGPEGEEGPTPKPGTVVDTLLRAYIIRKVANLDPEKDLQIVPGVAPADMPAALFVAREVDAGITWEPFASQAEAKFKNARVLYDAAAEWKKKHPNQHTFIPPTWLSPPVVHRSSRRGVEAIPAAYVETIDFINKNPARSKSDNCQGDQAGRRDCRQGPQEDRLYAGVDVPAAFETWSGPATGYLKEIPSKNKLFDLSYLPVQAAARKR